MYNKGKSTFLLLFAVGMVGCSTAPEEAATEENETNQTTSGVYDPLEGFNRAMWEINYDYLDPYLVRPISLAYVDYTPVPVRSGIANFLANLDEPASVVNNLVMGNGTKASITLTDSGLTRLLVYLACSISRQRRVSPNTITKSSVVWWVIME